MVTNVPQAPSLRSDSLERLLLSYLAKAVPGRIPGCDGMTTQHMLQDYAGLAAQGFVPGYGQLKRWHPDFQFQLEIFFREALEVEMPQTGGKTHRSQR